METEIVGIDAKIGNPMSGNYSKIEYYCPEIVPCLHFNEKYMADDRDDKVMLYN